jgi:choline dehydrogenase-like flavoprotein
MEAAGVALATALAGNAADVQNININRNKIGTTHHEAGTLWMGDPGQSVTDSFGKFHHLDTNPRVKKVAFSGCWAI